MSVLWAYVGMRVPAIQDLEMQVEYNANLARAAPYALHSARCMPHAACHTLHAARRTLHSAGGVQREPITARRVCGLLHG